MIIQLLMMEAASISERSVNVHQTTRRNNPEDSHIRTRRRENLKSHILVFFFVRCMSNPLLQVCVFHKAARGLLRFTFASVVKPRRERITALHQTITCLW
jgi:hypothetical protein